jgi:hypothetical protein
VELYPQSKQTIVQGGSALFQCRITAGIPTPKIKWSRVDGRPMAANVEELEGGVIRFVFKCHRSHRRDLNQLIISISLQV